MSRIKNAWLAFRGKPLPSAPNTTGNQHGEKTSEKGHIADPERSVQYLYEQMQIDPNLRAAIVMLRQMDRIDPRVKKIHRRIARAFWITLLFLYFYIARYLVALRKPCFLMLLIKKYIF